MALTMEERHEWSDVSVYEWLLPPCWRACRALAAKSHFPLPYLQMPRRLTDRVISFRFEPFPSSGAVISGCRFEFRKLDPKAFGHEIITYMPVSHLVQFSSGPSCSVDLPAGGHEVAKRIVDIERVCIETATGEQMRDGVERHLGREGGILAGEIACGPDQGCRGRLGIRGAAERDVEISGGLGRGEPFALAAMQRDQIHQNPTRIAVRVAFHQIPPHGEPGVARCEGQSEAVISLVGFVLPQENGLAVSCGIFQRGQFWMSVRNRGPKGVKRKCMKCSFRS